MSDQENPHSRRFWRGTAVAFGILAGLFVFVLVFKVYVSHWAARYVINGIAGAVGVYALGVLVELFDP